MENRILLKKCICGSGRKWIDFVQKKISVVLILEKRKNLSYNTKKNFCVTLIRSRHIFCSLNMKIRCNERSIFREHMENYKTFRCNLYNF